MPQEMQPLIRKRATNVRAGGLTRRPVRPRVRLPSPPSGDGRGLAEAREELRRQIAAHAGHTLPAMILGYTGRMIGRALPAKTRIPTWGSALALALLNLLVPAVLVWLAGDVARLSKLQVAELLSVDVGLVLTLMAYYWIHQYFALVRDHLAGSIESESDLRDLGEWVAEAWATRRAAAWSIFFALLWTAFGSYFFSRSPGGFLDLGIVAAMLIFGIFAGLGIYYLFWILRLPPRLGRYHYRMFGLDPLHSEVVDQVSRLLTGTAYTAALLSAGLTLWDTSNRALIWNSAGTVAFGWIPLIALFIDTQMALARIVRQARWQTLNRLQAEIERLWASGATSDGEARARLDWLLGLHERVKTTPSSAVDLRAALNFLNQLLLPVIAFLLGNLGDIQRLLGLAR